MDTAMVPRKTVKFSSLQAASSSSQTIRRPPVDFGRDWQGRATSSDGTEVLAEYKIGKPSDAPAHFHMLLDASGSMNHEQGPDGKRVYVHLFTCFEELVKSGVALRSHDVIYVWAFNTRPKLLCEVEARDYHRKKDLIRSEYKKELNQRRETRLYDAVAQVMDQKIRPTWERNKTHDFFLVTFTDGRDRGTGATPLRVMMQKLMEFAGRLHTYFITVNLPTSSDLYKRLALQTEMKLIHCESTQPGEISRAFNEVRDLIKAVLVVVTKKKSTKGTLPEIVRVVEYAKTTEEIGDQMMASLATGMRRTSLLEAYNNLRLTNK